VSIKKPVTVAREIRRLRKLIDSDPDKVRTRVAYAVETALRWATEDTTGWPPPSKDVLLQADCLKKGF
jgi:hypothetical protein